MSLIGHFSSFHYFSLNLKYRDRDLEDICSFFLSFHQNIPASGLKRSQRSFRSGTHALKYNFLWR